MASSKGIIGDISKELEMLLEQSRKRRITPDEEEAQRRSFAYGNTHFKNERITRETVDRAAEALKAAPRKKPNDPRAVA